jgi:hypothetical protein
MSYKGTPASSQIIWLEQRIKELESGPGGIMEMKQTIADKEQRIEKLESQFKLYFHAFNKAAARIEKLEAVLRKYANCVCESNCDEKSGQVCQLWACRKALEGKEPLDWTENYGQGSEPWLNKE